MAVRRGGGAGGRGPGFVFEEPGDLWPRATRALGVAAVRLSPDAEATLLRYIRAGEERLRRESQEQSVGRSEEEARRRAQRLEARAEANLDRLVKEIIRAGEENRDRTVSELQISEIFKRFCPIWPFC